MIGEFPPNLFDVVFVGGVDAEAMMPLVCLQVKPPFTAIGPDSLTILRLRLK